MEELVVLSERLAVVGDGDEDGLLPPSCTLEDIDHRANVLVEPTHALRIVRPPDPQSLRTGAAKPVPQRIGPHIDANALDLSASRNPWSLSSRGLWVQVIPPERGPDTRRILPRGRRLHHEGEVGGPRVEHGKKALVR